TPSHAFGALGRQPCSYRRSTRDRSRRAALLVLAGSSPRLAHSRTHRKIAGGVSCHSPRQFHMPPPRSVSCVWTRVASRQQRKLQMRSLQRKFIGEPPRLQDPLQPSPRKAARNELVWLKPIVNPISVAEDWGSSGKPDQRPA